MAEEMPSPRQEAVEGIGARHDADLELSANSALSRLYRTLISPASSIEEIASKILEEARRFTGSDHGYATSIDPASGDNRCHSLTEMVAERCRLSEGDRKVVFSRGPDGKYPGLWGHALNTQESFYTNDPASHPASRGLPERHLPIANFLSVPVLAGAELVGQIALANAPRPYSHRDLALVERLAEPYALSILRIRAEGLLRESESTHRMVVENLSEGLWCIDPDGYTTYVNHRMAEMLGYSVEEFLGKHIFHFLDERGVESGKRNLQKCSEGVRENLEVDLIRKDGARIHTILQTSPVQDARGAHTGSVAGVLDITERKKMEEDLRRERNFASAVLSTLGALVVVLDGEGRIVRFNRACELLTGYSFEEVRGTFLWNLLIPEECDSVKAVFSSLRSGQFPNQHENYWVAKDGTRKLIAWSNTALVGEGGAVDFVIGTGIDVSELRQVESQLRRLNEGLEREVNDRTAVAEQRAAKLQALALELTRAEQRERRKLAQVLHDQLQQLLVGARLRAGALRGRLRGLGLLKTVADLDALLGQAIDASRSLTIDLSPPILHEEGLCGGLRWLARTMEEEHGLKVEVDTEEEMSPRDAALSTFLYEACRELLFNVIKHAGTDRARVTLRSLGAHQVEIVVEDDGVGISAPGGSNGQASGGFGLFSIRERVELLGGRMDIQSAAGAGTRVRLLTPLSERQIREDGLDSHGIEVEAEDGLASDLKKAPPVRVVIVGSHEVLRAALAALLGGRKEIAVVGESPEGPSAVEMVGRLRPDAVVVSLNASSAGAMEAVRRMRSVQPSVRIVGIPVDDDPGAAGRMLDAGAEACIGSAGAPEGLLAALLGFPEGRGSWSTESVAPETGAAERKL